MQTNTAVIIKHLRPAMGDFAEEFVALELSLIDKRYVDVEQRPKGLSVSFPAEPPHLSSDDYRELVENLKKSLEIIVGPYQTQKVLDRIEADQRDAAVSDEDDEIEFEMDEFEMDEFEPL